MLVDAVQRSSGRCGGANYWFIICWVPFGDWVYFFAVKIHDPEFARIWKRWFVKPVTIDQLRYNFRHSPSAVNQLALAEALVVTGEYEEAESLLEAVVRADKKDREANFLLGLCKREQSDLAGACEAFERVCQSDITYRNFEAASELASSYWELGKKEEAVEFLRKLFKKSRRLAHTIELAKYLVEMDQRDEAREVLATAMDDFHHAPRFVKNLDKSAAKEASHILRAL